jgi:hypothetical protein
LRAADATVGPVEAKTGFPTDFSAIAAWLAHSEVKLAGASIVLQLRRCILPRLAPAGVPFTNTREVLNNYAMTKEVA